MLNYCNAGGKLVSFIGKWKRRKRVKGKEVITKLTLPTLGA